MNRPPASAFSLSPAIDVDSEGGINGRYGPLTPALSPAKRSLRKRTSRAGERGQKYAAADNSEAHTSRTLRKIRTSVVQI